MFTAILKPSFSLVCRYLLNCKQGKPRLAPSTFPVSAITWNTSACNRKILVAKRGKAHRNSESVLQRCMQTRRLLFRDGEGRDVLLDLEFAEPVHRYLKLDVLSQKFMRRFLHPGVIIASALVGRMAVANLSVTGGGAQSARRGDLSAGCPPQGGMRRRTFSIRRRVFFFHHVGSRFGFRLQITQAVLDGQMEGLNGKDGDF
jgi:hypothetical protein